ncbi:hypothetical protein QYF36_019344 [Acer negundo]|nr:hypothetical protein QYF36_019344 [Acer negundo]
MSYLRRLCMAASVAAVEGQTDKISKWNSNLHLLPPLNSTINNMSTSSMQDSSDYHSRIQNFATAAGGDNNQDSLQRVIFTMANFGFLGGKASCENVFGVRSGDTCTGIAQMFKLSTVTFDSNNPNLNCDALFVGQWLCVAA